jgi:hypothetical protein
MKPSSALALSATLVAAWLALPGEAPPGPAGPAPGPAGIEVTGAGEATLKPDTVVIRGDLTVSAESANDALTKYRDSRRRAVKMLEDLGIPGFSIAGPGPTISVGFAMNDRAAFRNMFDGSGETVEPKAIAHETLVARITGLTDLDSGANAVVKVLDKAKEAGVKIGSDSLNPYEVNWMGFAQAAQRKERPDVAVAYVVSDPAKAEEAACAKAMEDARRRAEMLARLAGRKLGPPTTISQEEIGSEKLSFDGTFRARLRITFGIE